MKVLTSTRLLKSGQPCGYPAKGLVLAGLFVLAGMNSFAQSTVTTLANIYGSAGTGSASSTPVLTTTAKFNYPAGIALDPAGTSLFLADYNNNAVRWVSNLGNQSSSYTYSAYVSTDGINHPIAVGIGVSWLVHAPGRAGILLDLADSGATHLRLHPHADARAVQHGIEYHLLALVGLAVQPARGVRVGDVLGDGIEPGAFRVQRRGGTLNAWE